MRRLLSLLPCLVLLACSNYTFDLGPPPAAPADELMRASFPRGGVTNVIRIDVRDPLPLRAAELVAPDGVITAASSLDAVRAPQASSGQETQKAPWLNSRFDQDNPVLPNGAPMAAFRTDTQTLLMLSTAEITLPDPVAYRRDWAGYKIRLGFAAGGSQLQIRVIGAPAPPPE
jgi:hypothetical protein